jgi:hypothetical protein
MHMVNVRLYFRTHSGHIGAGFVLDEKKLSSREKRAIAVKARCRARLVRSLLAHARNACVRLRAYSSRAPSDRRRQAHPCLGPSTPSPLATSEPAHASSASPSPPLVYPERARTARTLALLADCAHACDPRADANDSRNRSYYGSGHAGQGPRAKVVVCDPSRFTPPLDAHVCSARPPAERHDGTMHEHVQRTTHRRSTLGAGTLSRVGEHGSSHEV